MADETTEATAGESSFPERAAAPVNRRQVLPPAELRGLAEAFAEVIRGAVAAGIGDPRRLADRCAVFVAPQLAELGADLADARLRVDQTGEAMSDLTAEVGRLGALAQRRHAVAARLRQSLAAVKIDADRFRGLTPQTCAAGLHTGWLVPSNGRRYRCPWCLVPADMAGHLTRLAEALGIEAPEDDVDLYAEVHALRATVTNLREEILAQPGYADRHRDCVKLGGYCADVHVHNEDDPHDGGESLDVLDDVGDVTAPVLRDLLLLVGVSVTEDQVGGWSPEQRGQAARWALSTHLSASDNPVPVPPRPAFLDPAPIPAPVSDPDGEPVVCRVHGPHPHAGLSCPDCPTCGGVS